VSLKSRWVIVTVRFFLKFFLFTIILNTLYSPVDAGVFLANRSAYEHAHGFCLHSTSPDLTLLEWLQAEWISPEERRLYSADVDGLEDWARGKVSEVFPEVNLHRFELLFTSMISCTNVPEEASDLERYIQSIVDINGQVFQYSANCISYFGRDFENDVCWHLFDSEFASEHLDKVALYFTGYAGLSGGLKSYVGPSIGSTSFIDEFFKNSEVRRGEGDSFEIPDHLLENCHFVSDSKSPGDRVFCLFMDSLDGIFRLPKIVVLEGAVLGNFAQKLKSTNICEFGKLPEGLILTKALLNNRKAEDLLEILTASEKNLKVAEVWTSASLLSSYRCGSRILGLPQKTSFMSETTMDVDFREFEKYLEAENQETFHDISPNYEVQISEGIFRITYSDNWPDKFVSPVETRCNPITYIFFDQNWATSNPALASSLLYFATATHMTSGL